MAARIVICADDFGQSPAINDGIVQLAQQGRLSAASCMTLAPAMSYRLDELKASGIALGLHLNFTQQLGSEGYVLPLASLIVKSYLRLLDRTAIAREIARQLDAFEQHVGRAPDYVDGHQHVHQLPQIREALLLQLQQRYAAQPPWLRNTRSSRAASMPASYARKARIIAMLGSGMLQRLARQRGMTMNAHLLGVYDFAASADYPALLEAWLASAGDGDLLMCHPAAAATAGDELGEQRVREFAALAAPEGLPQLLARYRLQVGRLPLAH
ncbi:ChbG/HpnK family deacetylase [Vogesella oryzae]|uniref:ChbG/HpnK family deacetylase n=1 Tax=Vogesella oryzae TaxID=1735285 RepID=UPI0015827BF6|nr:ChbG/HpnK family deacetylase [Vogesella oryzae]